MNHLDLEQRRLDHDGASPFYRLLMTGRQHATRTILLDGVRAGWLSDPNEVGPHGWPVLLGYLGTFPAPPADRVWDARRLTDATHEPSWTTADGQTPEVLLEIQVALELLQRGANPWAQDPDGRDTFDQVASLMWTPMWSALMQRDDAPDVANLAARSQTITLRSGSSTAGQEVTLPWLHAAVRTGRVAWVEVLLAQGLDVNQVDHDGRTPLFHAQTADMVQRLIDAGADLFVLDGNGEPMSTVWSRSVRGVEHLNAMTRLMKPLLKERFEHDPEAGRAWQRPALYQTAASGTKDATLTFMRANGFTVNDRRVQQGRTESLLAHVALSMLNGTERSAVLQHLVERAEDPWFESVPGVPDLVVAWVASGGSQVALARAVEKRLRQRYDLALDRPDGWLELVSATVPAIERLGDWLIGHRPEALAGFGVGTAYLLDAGLNGRKDYASGRELERWQASAAEQPWVSLGKNINREGEEPRHAVLETLAPDGWDQAQDARGDRWVWRWASAGLKAFDLGEHHDRDESVARVVVNLLGQPARTNVPATPARCPYDRMAVHAMLGVLGNGPTHSDLINKRVPADAWDLNDPVRRAMREALDAGIEPDSRLAGFDARFRRVRTLYPRLAQELEGLVLHQSLDGEDAPAPAAAKPRSRL